MVREQKLHDHKVEYLDEDPPTEITLDTPTEPEPFVEDDEDYMQ